MFKLQVRPATPAEIARWDELVAANPNGGDFIQTDAYARTKQQVGWNIQRLVWVENNKIVSVSLVLERRLPVLGKYWYLPHGPAVTTTDEATEHLSALRRYISTHEKSVFAVTSDPLILDTEENLAAIAGGAAFGAHWRPGIQGNTSTAVVPLAPDAELLASFHKRSRNMVSRAIRDGVTVREYPADNATFAHMHRLMRLVGGGSAQLRLRSEQYAETFWSEFAASGQGRFYGIEVEGSPALLAFVIRVGSHAFYKDGGSERHRTTPGMSNLLQFEMMRAMRDEGAVDYDMMGVPPRDRLDDPDAPNHSLATFKLSFSRAVTQYVGAYDTVMKPRQYAQWQHFGLPLAQRLHRRKYRDLDLF